MTKLHEFRGVRYSTGELSKLSGISAQIILTRLAEGWTLEQALCIPSVQQRRRGVVMNFPPFEGTGAGGALKAPSEITFPEKVASE